MKSISVRITGLVQGVGFRPFVAEQAQVLQLSGWVKNSGGIVIVRLIGSDKAVKEWFHRLYHFTPEGARIDSVSVDEDLSVDNGSDDGMSGGFRIISSSREEEELRFLPPDMTICENCEKELWEKANRRYRHPFISCTSCGPRYSILKDVPYDRENITMNSFEMCGECKSEYTMPGNRRRHAQTIACHSCGPVLLAQKSCSEELLSGEEALAEAVSVLHAGEVIAVKDIGGYHFASLASNERGAKKLREFKGRDKKPFAVMFSDMESVRKYCVVSAQEEEILRANERPIVLLRKKKDFPEPVCGESNRIGAMLPCNPLQILLLKETGPLIMTSGNLGGEPIIISNEKMINFLRNGFPKLVLFHDREILEPLEDSIYQVSEPSGTVQLIRRARGLVPEPVMIKRELPVDCFAAGGDLKAVFAFGKKNAVYLSGSFGDLIHPDAADAREVAMQRMSELFVMKPEYAVCDKHPAYVSAKNIEYAIRVQHHHAHIASVMAEYGLEGKVLGIAFDGTGYGDDGTVWGSEFLLCEGKKYERKCSLEPVDMPAGDRTAKDAWVPLMCYLDEAVERGLLEEEEVLTFCGNAHRGQFSILQAAREKGIGQIQSSSMGRLFDSVAVILGICEENSYEGECPVMLEQAAFDSYKMTSYKKTIDREKANCTADYLSEREGQMFRLDGTKFIADIFRAKKRGESVQVLALTFHEMLADLTILACEKICGNSIRQIALSGGTWYNQILLERVIKGLRQKGYEVYVNRKVPSGDGGLALGQMWLATFEQ